MRALRPLLLVLGAVAVGVAVGLVVLTRGDDLPPADPEGSRGTTLLARTAVEPHVALFGQTIVAQAEFVVDPGRVLPDTIRYDGDFRPFTQVGGTRTETRAGDLVRVRYRFRLSCASPECAPTDATRVVELPSGNVIYVRRAPPGQGLPDVRGQDVVSWPAFTVASRLGPFDVERAQWRADLAELPSTTRRASPAVLGAALLGGAALLALLGAGLIASQLRRPRVADEEPEEVVRVTPLERALAAVTQTSANGAGDDRRRSLERLARELAATGRGELAARARRLAWSPQQADGRELDSLTADVRAVVEEQR